MRIEPHRTQGGFSLLEILVAFSVMALSLGVLLRIFGGSGQIAQTADEYSRAIVTAESVLASAGVETPLRPGVSQGVADGVYRWTLNVTPYPIDEALLGSQAGNPSRPYWVDLEIEWGDDSDPRGFSLKTLRLLSTETR